MTVQAKRKRMRETARREGKSRREKSVVRQEKRRKNEKEQKEQEEGREGTAGTWKRM